ncbi:MAG: 4'-phosphopantetheinyl transferase family protein [Bosea sp. (in: a-proteobacteria)]
MSNTIIWHHNVLDRAPRLPAVWLVDTGESPANLIERSGLRRRVGREVAAIQLEVPLHDIEIGHDRAGRPLLQGIGNTTMHISLATRGGIVAVALALDPVGVDVEAVEPQGHIPVDLLHPAEQAAVLAMPASEQASHFTSLWALKEAWLKALGTGLARELSSFAIAIAADGTIRIDDPTQHGVRQPLASTTQMKKGGQLFAAALVVRS